mmetsp:Transcript_32284/g.63935  ORF Transcript_32284/g.63935 Transcript_32284/m.63935 type:complete len:501 (-) Transcript_32284:342-1844(-)
MRGRTEEQNDVLGVHGEKYNDGNTKYRVHDGSDLYILSGKMIFLASDRERREGADGLDDAAEETVGYAKVSLHDGVRRERVEAHELRNDEGVDNVKDGSGYETTRQRDGEVPHPFGFVVDRGKKYEVFDAAAEILPAVNGALSTKYPYGPGFVAVSVAVSAAVTSVIVKLPHNLRVHARHNGHRARGLSLYHGLHVAEGHPGPARHGLRVPPVGGRHGGRGAGVPRRGGDRSPPPAGDRAPPPAARRGPRKHLRARHAVRRVLVIRNLVPLPVVLEDVQGGLAEVGSVAAAGTAGHGEGVAKRHLLAPRARLRVRARCGVGSRAGNRGRARSRSCAACLFARSDPGSRAPGPRAPCLIVVSAPGAAQMVIRAQTLDGSPTSLTPLGNDVAQLVRAPVVAVARHIVGVGTPVVHANFVQALQRHFLRVRSPTVGYEERHEHHCDSTEASGHDEHSCTRLEGGGDVVFETVIIFIVGYRLIHDRLYRKSFAVRHSARLRWKL